MSRTAKKARQGSKQQERDIAAPSAERRRHGLIEREGTTVKDANGAVGLPFRALTTIDIMLRRGSITPDMFRAGETFHRQFVLAALGPLAAAAPTRLPVLLSGTRYHGPRGSERARTHVLRALAALGGPATHLGSCAWHVLGEELSLREWIEYRGANHRSINFASGVLVSALDLLRVHYEGRARP